jgi:hypothetical protein
MEGPGAAYHSAASATSFARIAAIFAWARARRSSNFANLR